MVYQLLASLYTQGGGSTAWGEASFIRMRRCKRLSPAQDPLAPSRMFIEDKNTPDLNRADRVPAPWLIGVAADEPE